MSKLKNKEWAGRSITLPVVGTVEFDKDGATEVSEEDHAAVMELNKDMGYPFGKSAAKKAKAAAKPVEKPVKKPVDDTPPEGTDEGSDEGDGPSTGEPNPDANPDEGKGEDTPPDEPTLAEKLAETKMDDLKALAVETGLPEEEWKGMKKKDDLVAYLVSKLEE